MVKIKYILTLALLLLPISAEAQDLSYPKSMQQGSTMEILIPANNINSVRGSLNQKEVTFFTKDIRPDDYDLISRGTFMQLLLSSTTFPVTEEGFTLYPDVPLTHPYATSIYRATSLGIVNGYEDGSFHPEDSLTRAQAAKILLQSFQLSQVAERIPLFTDLPSSHSLAKFIIAAIQAGLFQGYGDGTVKPDRPLNYIEAEILLQRAANIYQLPPRELEPYFRGFIGIHRTKDIGQQDLTLEISYANGEKKKINDVVTVVDTKYPTTSFSLPPSKTSLFANTAYNKTWELIDGAKYTTNPQQLWEGAFIIPTSGEVSMGFGNTVYINGAYSGSHFGIDYASNTGTPVSASNHGVVVLAEMTPSYGNTIIIDHGHNVFTMYMHLDKIHAAKAQQVTKGELIGEIGMTGIATGPHLHFTHFIGDVIVDSAEWFAGAY